MGSVGLRDAATVVLLRDTDRGPEVYLLRRPPTMVFAPGMHVFPGGAVDPRDADPHTGWVGPPPAAWSSRLAADETGVRALVCAAVRETFEECGVLLATTAAQARDGVGTAGVGTAGVGTAGGGTAGGGTAGADWERDRRALVAGTLPLSDLLVRRGLALRADLLEPWAHWVTPEGQPRRFDTRFFVARLPTGQQPRQVGGEADLASWVRPADALARHHRGELPLMPPTRATLEEVAGFATVAAVLAAAPGRRITRILPSTPVVPR